MKQVNSVFVCILIATTALAEPDPRLGLWFGVKRPENIVHLFEWRWDAIANECEQFLGPNGYKAIQISPANENAVFEGRPWWERYQPFSYRLITRSGNESQFADMVDRCNKVGVGIYVDVVFNHMTGSIGKTQGTSGDTMEINYWNYSTIPYTADDFHASCNLQDDTNATEVRVCQLSGLPDLNQTYTDVQQKISVFLNELIDVGVAGFRVDAAKHMWPEDLYKIYRNLSNLNERYFKKGQRPYIYQEVTYSASVKGSEYIGMGAVTEFPYSYNVGKAIQGINSLASLKDVGSAWGMVPPQFAVVFVDNHDSQREGHSEILTFKSPDQYIMANAFMLAHPYGTPSVMSSFNFTTYNQGPPSDASIEEITSPTFDPITGQCTNGWVCEHRWPQIRNMVRFRHVVGPIAPLKSWWDNGSDQIAFCRGSRGFVAFNAGDGTMSEQLKTCLPKGVYCDIISGGVSPSNSCTGITVYVDGTGKAQVTVNSNTVVALHVGQKLAPN